MDKYTTIMLVPVQFDFPAIDDADAKRMAVKLAEQTVIKVGHPPPVIYEIQKHEAPHGEVQSATP